MTRPYKLLRLNLELLHPLIRSICRQRNLELWDDTLVGTFVK